MKIKYNSKNNSPLTSIGEGERERELGIMKEKFINGNGVFDSVERRGHLKKYII